MPTARGLARAASFTVLVFAFMGWALWMMAKGPIIQSAFRVSGA